ncbi:DUF423 domain-containing protein [Mangrovitalea sediminis]|uniref:DUF423 domain-containing protein n=1 Tax=Mangrovitalea sediminis TaxID=1982043 RepID=UPI00387316F5
MIDAKTNRVNEVGWLQFAALLGLFAVLAGAFGAHALKGHLSAQWFDVYQTAVSYQMYHALAMLGVLALGSRVDPLWRRRSLALFGIGTVLFSGSLYLLVLAGWRPLGVITPLGGLCLIAGWGCLVLAARRALRTPEILSGKDD